MEIAKRIHHPKMEVHGRDSRCSGYMELQRSCFEIRGNIRVLNQFLMEDSYVISINIWGARKKYGVGGRINALHSIYESKLVGQF